MSRILMLAWGNPGRGDDGLGPTFAQAAQAVQHAPHTVAVATDFQLQPEHATDLVGHDAVRVSMPRHRSPSTPWPPRAIARSRRTP
jgi:Ni,Fe-hydrogenase maturation factor